MLITSSFEAGSLRTFSEILQAWGFVRPPREIHISFTSRLHHRLVGKEPSKGGADATVDVDRGGRLPRGCDARARADRAGGGGRSGRPGLRVFPLRAVPVPSVLHRVVPADPGRVLEPAVGGWGRPSTRPGQRS